MENLSEFDGERARLYEKAIRNSPRARDKDIEAMLKLLNPKKGESILGIGEGNGYFCKAIAESIGEEGFYYVTDPSKDQLTNLRKQNIFLQIEVEKSGAEDIEIVKKKFDKVWSFGAFHHCENQIKAMRRIYNSLRAGGIAVICDVFQGSSLAKHFDIQVARYCITGHEVKFLSEEFATTACLLAGFKKKNIKIINLDQKWVFESMDELGHFIYNLHAMTLLPGKLSEKIGQTSRGCKEILGVCKKGARYYLNWPMKALVIKK
jgi:arsenite methyltransferase